MFFTGGTQKLLCLRWVNIEMLQIMTCSKIYAASSQQEVLDGNGKMKNKTIPKAQAKVEASVKRNENNL